MKRLFLSISLFLLAFCTYSQELSQITFSGGITLSSFSFITDQQIIIKISPDGTVMEWGTPWDPRRYNYYPGKLDPYLGRVDYYGTEGDSASRGKVKSIGTCALTYYGPYESKEKIGKLKSIGRVMLDYYDTYENTAFKGKLKFVGPVLLSYYSSSDNEAFRSKLKSVNNTAITYYSTFDDKMLQGKIKTIGPKEYTWYSSNKGKVFQDPYNYTPAAQLINGIVYIVGY